MQPIILSIPADQLYGYGGGYGGPVAAMDPGSFRRGRMGGTRRNRRGTVIEEYYTYTEECSGSDDDLAALERNIRALTKKVR